MLSLIISENKKKSNV